MKSPSKLDIFLRLETGFVWFKHRLIYELTFHVYIWITWNVLVNEFAVYWHDWCSFKAKSTISAAVHIAHGFEQRILCSGTSSCVTLTQPLNWNVMIVTHSTLVLVLGVAADWPELVSLDSDTKAAVVTWRWAFAGLELTAVASWGLAGLVATVDKMDDMVCFWLLSKQL